MLLHLGLTCRSVKKAEKQQANKAVMQKRIEIQITKHSKWAFLVQ